MTSRLDTLVTRGRICSRAAEALMGASRAEVHSVFASSMNLAVDGELVHVGPDSLPLSCTGVAISGRALAPLLSVARPGDIALVRRGVLHVHADGACLGIVLGSLTPVDLSVRGLRVDEGGIALLADALRHLTLRPCGIEGDGAFREAADILARPRPSEAELGRAVSLLVGRGPGLTPSGDDILMGYGLGLWLTGGEAPFLRALRGTGDRTTDVSRAQLSAVGQGRVGEALHALAVALADRAPRRSVRLAAEGVGRIGHTSGADALRGLEIACERALAEWAAEHLSAVGW